MQSKSNTLKFVLTLIVDEVGMSKVSLFTITLLLINLQACSSSNDSSDLISSPGTANNSIEEQNNNTLNQTDSSSPGGLITASVVATPGSLLAAERAIVFDYTMTSVTGEPTTARAQLFEPKTPAPQDGHALVVWAHGTTGIANTCQPSASFQNFGNATAINALLSSGYAVLAPDYEGFGTDRIHPYYIRSSHANAITDSVPAAHEINGTNLSDDWAIVGHSQGGHVAMATARATALPAYPLQAVVALAPGTDLKPFSDQAFNAIDEKIAEGELENASERLYYLNVYAAYVAHAVKEVNPEFDPKSIFGEAIAPLIDTALTESFCGRYANSVELAMNRYFDSGGSIPDFQGLKRDWYNVPEIASRLEIEELGDELQSAPLLILQGDADRQVPVAATTAFVERQRSVGTDVTYEVIEGARHRDVARTEFNRAISWLNDKFPAQ